MLMGPLKTGWVVATPLSYGGISPTSLSGGAQHKVSGAASHSSSCAYEMPPRDTATGARVSCPLRSGPPVSHIQVLGRGHALAPQGG